MVPPIEKEKPHVVEEIWPETGKAFVRPQDAPEGQERIVLLEELIPWRDGLNWELEWLRSLKKRKEREISRKQRELSRIERRIEEIQKDDPSQLRFEVVDGRLDLSACVG